MSGFLAELKTVYHLVASPIRGTTHAERLESFYARQADGYDSFRERLLPGRRELTKSLPLEPGSVWVDLGGGTAATLEYAADQIPALQQVTVVDLSPSLLEVARARIDSHGWSDVRLLCDDVTKIRCFQPADVVTFSYSLTMIPDWIAAIDNAWSLLRPGGVLGVSDFYVSRKYASGPRVQHCWLTRTFWPTWFAMDNVFLNPDMLPYLQSRFVTMHCREGRSKVPWLPAGRVPYFVFVGRKPESAGLLN